MEITTHEALIITSALRSSPLQTANTVWWEFPCCTHGEDVLPSPGAGTCLNTAQSTRSRMHLCQQGLKHRLFTLLTVICGTFSRPLVFEHFTYCSCDEAISHDWQFSCAGAGANGAPNPFLQEEVRLQVP